MSRENLVNEPPKTPRPKSVPGCPLCDLDVHTHLYHEDETCIVVDCETCDIPMIVLKRHAREPSEAEKTHMMCVVRRLGMTVLRHEPRRIPDHAHWHLAYFGGSPS